MAAAGGADGMLLDVHVSSADALVDGFQAIDDEHTLARMIATWRKLREITQGLEAEGEARQRAE